MPANPAPLVDPFGRTVDYLRVSVTDRCDMRCVYCMAEHMTFLPRPEVLTLEEIERLCAAFIRLGTRRIRLTGGEPLVRRDIDILVRALGARLEQPPGTPGLDELTLTTNGSRLAEYAPRLREAGVRRVNVSLDTLDPARFRSITRIGQLERTLSGIEAALAAGLQVRVNTVAMRDTNEDELDSLVEWCGSVGADLCLIETMPLGDTGEDRTDRYLPLSVVRARLSRRWTLTDLPDRSPGPARYTRVAETGRRLGFITPLTHTFCESCNRVRLDCTGTLHLCLGQEHSADLRAVLRAPGADDRVLDAAIRAAIAIKPKGHDFSIGRRGEAPALSRHMSVTGG
ncbi:MAG: GTP 3',8-cyclase MoaA [Gluconacetobacter diazotrophicus]|nr:GTP 3',8-cyclase MoaA [Gluconacetobacter diazotrophicus]